MQQPVRRQCGRRRTGQFVTALAVLLIGVSTAALSLSILAPVASASHPALVAAFTDDFTNDQALNSNLWLVNGSAASNFSSENCPGCALLNLTPTFSSAGMEIAQADGNSEIGAIQSAETLAPPFTVNVSVEGIISNGHPFVFGISTLNGTTGVQITGNLNSTDCSHESDCGNPSVCGNAINPVVGSGECYYGIYARVGTGGPTWAKSPMLNLTPNVGLVYALQISVESSGNIQVSITQGGLLLSQDSEVVGTGPYYIMLAQSEGVPVHGPGPNEAEWLSASVSSWVPATTPSSSSPSSSSGFSSLEWILVLLVVAVAIVALIVIVRRRGRELNVSVLDADSLSPLPGAMVSADGSKSYTGSTGANGQVALGGLKSGDYTVRAGASGYTPSTPVTVSLPRTTQQTVRLQRMAPETPSAVPTPVPAPAPTAVPAPVVAAIVSPPAPPVPASAPPTSPEVEGSEGWAGERIREIVRTFQAKGALSPETALSADELGLSRMFVRIMKRRRGKTKVFVEVNGKYYLDEQALRGMR